MILSMTGYGDTQYSDGKVAYALAIRTLNNRYFKASVKLPDHLSMFETDVEKLLRERLSRGSVYYNLRIRNISADAAQDINLAAVESYLQQLNQVSVDHQTQLDIGAILNLPGVCQPPELSEEERIRAWTTIESMTAEALDRLIDMRRIEGQCIRDDLVFQCKLIRDHLQKVEERAKGVVQEYHQRLLQRANELLASAKLQLKQEDVAREVALFAERSDINEEISRLGSHLEQFEQICDASQPTGRKLDFLAQEMLREANTIASKSNDANIAHNIVEIKGSIDRLKEQVQNAE
jgi:uncharacterized protein (TIGR00255 family)